MKSSVATWRWPAIAAAAGALLLLLPMSPLYATAGAMGWMQQPPPSSPPDDHQQAPVAVSAASVPPSPLGAPPAPHINRDLTNEKIADLYRQALTTFAGGQSENACMQLMSMETAVVDDRDNRTRKRLLRAEETVIHAIAADNIDVLIPIAMLHFETAKRYLDHEARGYTLVLNHSRGMVRDLALLYNQQSENQKGAQIASNILTMLAELFESRAQHLSAADLFGEAALLDGKNAAAGLNLALVFEKYEQYKAAATALRKLLQSDPENREAKLRLAINLKRTEHHGEAVKLLEQLVAAPDDTWITTVAYEECAALEVADDHFAIAEKLLRAGIARRPASATMRVQLSDLLEKKGSVKESRAVIEELVNQPGGDDDNARSKYNSANPEVFVAVRATFDENVKSRMPALANALGVKTVAGGR
jgi:tetratricopeptide (TPR) repeat protein